MATLTKDQEQLLNGITKEFSKINEKYAVKKSTNPFDLSNLVDDIADKQKAIDEATALRLLWEKKAYAQLLLDVKKIDKVLNKIGFRVETHTQNNRRIYPSSASRADEKYPQIIISHLTNRRSVNFSSYENSFTIGYETKNVRGRREDVNSTNGFYVVLRGASYDFNQPVNTIEEAFENSKLKDWIKNEYEKATLKR